MIELAIQEIKNLFVKGAFYLFRAVSPFVTSIRGVSLYIYIYACELRELVV